MTVAENAAPETFRDEELLADVICRLIGDVRHVAVGAASPIPATAALLAREGCHTPLDILDGTHGLFGSLTANATPLQVGMMGPTARLRW